MEDSNDSYYLRSKRRKIDGNEEGASSSKGSPNHPHISSFKRKNPIMHIPIEILQIILKFLTYQELSEKVRLVNRRFKLAAEDVLNRGFMVLPKKIQPLINTTSSAIQATQDDMEIKCLCRLLNMLEIILFQQNVAMATIWRYVYNDFYRTTSSCMYAGRILDFYEIFFFKFTTTPYLIYGPAVVKDYAVPDEVRYIIQLTKCFCIHFDKISEEPIKNALSVAASKIVDFLDCAPHAKKIVKFEKHDENVYTAEYRYYLHNAWFVAFNIPPEKEMTNNQEQRLMHMRIRRIILAHTEMFMQQDHYQRELLVRIAPIIKKPSVMVYTGYGDVHDTFFCYGAMNDAAYLQKFHVLQDQEQSDEDEEDDDVIVDRFNPDEDNNPEIGNETNTVPHLGLDICVRVECPLAYAPLKYLMDYRNDVKKFRNSSNRVFKIDVCFNCPGASYPRLPTTYQYTKHVVNVRV